MRAAEGADPGADLLHDAAELVAQHPGRLDQGPVAAPGVPVAAADAAAPDAHHGVTGRRLGLGQVAHLKGGAELGQDRGSHEA